MTVRNCSTCQTCMVEAKCYQCEGPLWPYWTEKLDVPQVAADSHYKFSFNGVKLDPYRILDVYQISHPAQQHAIKKLLRAGKSVKTLRQDVEEVQMTLTRWLEMMDEVST